MRLICICWLALSLVSCKAQKSLILEIDEISLSNETKEFCNSNLLDNKKVVVLVNNGCNGIYYFVFKAYVRIPDWLINYLETNTKYLRLNEHEIPILTDLDYLLYYNKEVSIEKKEGDTKIRSHVFLDGSYLGKSNTHTLALELRNGTFGPIIEDNDLIQH